MTTQPGWVAIWRNQIDHPIVGARKPYCYYIAWQWLLFEAAFQPRRISVSNGRELVPITLQRGQLSHSLRYMAQAWGWRSPMRVKRFLTRLETDTQIATQTDAEQTVKSVAKYDR